MSWRGYERMVGAGLMGERVAIRVEGGEGVLSYATRQLRRLEIAQLRKGRITPA